MKGSKAFLFFALFWSAMTLLFDGFVVVPAVRQVMALRFPSTEGVILSGEVTHHDDSDGTTYGVAIHYSYSVGNCAYEGHRYRYDKSTSSDSAWANAAVAERPPGTKVRVYYNPSDPDDSVLAPGLLGSDLFMMAFMTPFNAVMLGFGWAGWGRMRRRWFPPVAGGVRILEGARETRVRLTTFSPLIVFVGTVALLAFVSIFIVCFLTGSGFHPPLRTMVVTWGIILGGGLGTAGWQWWRSLTGRYDLIYDEVGGALELPLTHGRKARRRVSLDAIRDVWVKTVRKPSSGDEESAPAYAPTLTIHGSEPAEERLVEWYDQEKAQAFVTWLNAKRPPPKTIQKRPLAGRF
jgi:hypothetical protein